MSVRTSPDAHAHTFDNTGWIESAIDRVNTTPGEGFTLNADLSEWDVSKGGFIATVTMESVPAGDLTKDDLLAFREKYSDVLDTYDGRAKIGAFHLEGANQVDIDLNIRVESREDAVEIGERFNQESVFDANSFDLIPTGGRGECVADDPEAVYELVVETLAQVE